MRKVLCLSCFLAYFSLGTLSWGGEPAAPQVERTKEVTWTQRLFSAALRCVNPQADASPAAEVAPAGVTLLGEQPEETPIDEQATHEQANLIELAGKNDSFKIHAFTLDKQGRLLVACEGEQGEVRVVDGDGKLLATWKLEIKPEAINVAPDSSVLVAGAGKIIRLSSDGKVLQEVDAPHVTLLKENKQKLRESAIAALKQRSGDVSGQLESMEKMLSQIEEKSQTETLNEEDERILKLLPDYIKQLKTIQLARADKAGSEPTEAAIEEQVKSLLKSKQGVSSISADEAHVYLATPALSGYTYEVWRMDPDFTNAEVIVSDLRGCCGHMDVQASSSGIYVAENARHRVVSYQPNGKEITEWGGRDRTGINGFTSCCNPMNVCFNRTGDVFTAESSTGRIKRFSSQGKFKEFVGDVKLVPGCKNVSIAVSSNDASVYMLDITRNHIVHMKRKVSTEKVE